MDKYGYNSIVIKWWEFHGQYYWMHMDRCHLSLKDMWSCNLSHLCRPRGSRMKGSIACYYFTWRFRAARVLNTPLKIIPPYHDNPWTFRSIYWEIIAYFMKAFVTVSNSNDKWKNCESPSKPDIHIKPHPSWHISSQTLCTSNRYAGQFY